MDNRTEIRDFLAGRRAKITPERAGLPAYGGNRLSTRSEVFRTWWAAHNVRLHRTGVKRLHHPEVGELTLAYESMELTADPGLRLNAYSAEPGTPSGDALRLLASWTAPHPEQNRQP